MYEVIIDEIGQTINIENKEDFYKYYIEARFLKSIPTSLDVYYFYTMAIEKKVNILESEFHYDEKGVERGYSDMHTQEILNNTMSLESIESILDYLRLFYVNQHNVMRNSPFVNIW